MHCTLPTYSKQVLPISELEENISVTVGKAVFVDALVSKDSQWQIIEWQLRSVLEYNWELVSKHVEFGDYQLNYGPLLYIEMLKKP